MDYTEDQVHDILRGACDAFRKDVDKVRDSLPCSEHGEMADQARGLVEKIAQDIEDVQKARSFP